MTKPAVHLPEDIRRRIIEHCEAELPNEACGLLAVSDGEVVTVYPTRNADRSPTSYTVDPADHIGALLDAESKGWELGGVYHSHPNGPAELSDIDRAKALEPEWIHVVVGFGGGEPEVRIFD